MRQALRARREEFGLSQEDMATKLGIDRSTYVRYESGLRMPALPVAFRIAEILQADAASLFLDSVPDQPKEASSNG